MATKLKTWNRLPGETTKAHNAFLIYRDLGPDRSLLKAYRVRKGHQEGTERDQAPGYFKRWSIRYDWATRAVAWDDSIANGKERLTRHLATQVDNHRLQRHLSVVETFEPLLLDLIQRVRDRDIVPLDTCRLLREIRELEGALECGFGPRLSRW